MCLSPVKFKLTEFGVCLKMLSNAQAIPMQEW